MSGEKLWFRLSLTVISRRRSNPYAVESKLSVSFAGYLKTHTEEEPSLPLCRGFMLVRYAVCLLNQLRNRYSCFHKP